jgi:Circularly permutated YpsA SLOG family
VALPALIIITGGQTGVDRAALDAAIALGIPYAGWCPKGGWAEDFPEPPGLLAHYPHLRETPSADPAQRTEWNVRDAEATLILTDAGGIVASRGTALARQLAARSGNPVLLVNVGLSDARECTVAWLGVLMTEHANAAQFRLGIGGPRESEAPGIYHKARELIRQFAAPLS